MPIGPQGHTQADSGHGACREDFGIYSGPRRPHCRDPECKSCGTPQKGYYPSSSIDDYLQTGFPVMFLNVCSPMPYFVMHGMQSGGWQLMEADKARLKLQQPVYWKERQEKLYAEDVGTCCDRTHSIKTERLSDSQDGHALDSQDFLASRHARVPDSSSKKDGSGALSTDLSSTVRKQHLRPPEVYECKSRPNLSSSTKRTPPPKFSSNRQPGSHWYQNFSPEQAILQCSCVSSSEIYRPPKAKRPHRFPSPQSPSWTNSGSVSPRHSFSSLCRQAAELSVAPTRNLQKSTGGDPSLARHSFDGRRSPCDSSCDDETPAVGPACAEPFQRLSSKSPRVEGSFAHRSLPDQNIPRDQAKSHRHLSSEDVGPETLYGTTVDQLSDLQDSSTLPSCEQSSATIPASTRQQPLTSAQSSRCPSPCSSEAETFVRAPRLPDLPVDGAQRTRAYLGFRKTKAKRRPPLPPAAQEEPEEQAHTSTEAHSCTFNDSTRSYLNYSNDEPGLPNLQPYTDANPVCHQVQRSAERHVDASSHTMQLHEEQTCEAPESCPYEDANITASSEGALIGPATVSTVSRSNGTTVFYEEHTGVKSRPYDVAVIREFDKGVFISTTRLPHRPTGFVLPCMTARTATISDEDYPTDDFKSSGLQNQSDPGTSISHRLDFTGPTTQDSDSTAKLTFEATPVASKPASRATQCNIESYDDESEISDQETQSTTEVTSSHSLYATESTELASKTKQGLDDQVTHYSGRTLSRRCLSPSDASGRLSSRMTAWDDQDASPSASSSREPSPSPPIEVLQSAVGPEEAASPYGIAMPQPERERSTLPRKHHKPRSRGRPGRKRKLSWNYWEQPKQPEIKLSREERKIVMYEELFAKLEEMERKQKARKVLWNRREQERKAFPRAETTMTPRTEPGSQHRRRAKRRLRPWSKKRKQTIGVSSGTEEQLAEAAVAGVKRKVSSKSKMCQTSCSPSPSPSPRKRRRSPPPKKSREERKIEEVEALFRRLEEREKRRQVSRERVRCHSHSLPRSSKPSPAARVEDRRSQSAGRREQKTSPNALAGTSAPTLVGVRVMTSALPRQPVAGTSGVLQTSTQTVTLAQGPWGTVRVVKSKTDKIGEGQGKIPTYVAVAHSLQPSAGYKPPFPTSVPLQANGRIDKEAYIKQSMDRFNAFWATHPTLRNFSLHSGSSTSGASPFFSGNQPNEQARPPHTN